MASAETSIPSVQGDPSCVEVPQQQNRVGALQYTRMGLTALFFWLLWGDFCFVLMEQVPTLINLRLNHLEAPTWLIGMISTSLPNILILFVNPVVSVSSDRCRSRWGRRIPFLAFATPFVTLFLVFLAYSEPIGAAIHAHILPMVSESTVTLTILALFIIGFNFFNAFISSVFYYLFNDVVPAQFLVRFMMMFRLVGGLAMVVYNEFFIARAETHMQELILTAAVLYLVSFALLCWNVKEGAYPPPEPLVKNEKPGPIALVKSYFRECFQHRIYWYFFLANTFFAIAASAVFAYKPIWAKSVGVPLDLYGHIEAIGNTATIVLTLAVGLLMNRIHPLKMIIVATALMVVSQVPYLYFVFTNPSAELARILYIGIQVLFIPMFSLYYAVEIPMYMRLLSKERYGQYCSANAMFRSFALIPIGIAVGWSIDVIGTGLLDQEHKYRFVPLWIAFCLGICLVFLILLQREWKSLGGERDYQPPV